MVLVTTYLVLSEDNQLHIIMATGIRIQLVTFLLSLTVVRGDELRFLVIGDWGGIPLWPYTTPYETAVSSGMGKIAQQLGTQFTVALGRKYGFYCFEDCRSTTALRENDACNFVRFNEICRGTTSENNM